MHDAHGEGMWDPSRNFNSPGWLQTGRCRERKILLSVWQKLYIPRTKYFVERIEFFTRGLQRRSRVSIFGCIGNVSEISKLCLIFRHKSHSPKEIQNVFSFEALNTTSMKWSSLILTPNANVNLQVTAIKYFSY